MTYKTILKGRLEFGSPKSFDKVSKMYQWRVENYHKNDVLVEYEDIFNEEEHYVLIPRMTTQSTMKSWNNTLSILDYLAQYAVAGNVNLWMTEDGKILRHKLIEPTSERSAVLQYKKGRDLAKKEGRQEEAMTALDGAIAKFDKHAQAYERRAYINRVMGKHHDAIRDYTKSINIDGTMPHSFYGRAIVNLIDEKYEEAISDFDACIKRSIPLEPIYWKARRLKGVCYYNLKQFDKADFEFKLFNKRFFTDDNPNIAYRKWGYYHHGNCLVELERYGDALEQYDKAVKTETGSDKVKEADLYAKRGLARYKAGERGFLADWKRAKEMGSVEAKQYLAQHKK